MLCMYVCVLHTDIWNTRDILLCWRVHMFINRIISPIKDVQDQIATLIFYVYGILFIIINLFMITEKEKFYDHKLTVLQCMYSPT